MCILNFEKVYCFKRSCNERRQGLYHRLFCFGIVSFDIFGLIAKCHARAGGDPDKLKIRRAMII